jgi:hypothetical protein
VRTQLSKLFVVVGVIVAAIMLTMICPQPARAKAEVIKQSFSVPLDGVFQAADFPCLTEDVHVFGTIETQTQAIVDGNGGLHLRMHEVANLSAVGLSTGDRYHTQGPLSFLVHDFDTDPNNGLREVLFHNIIQLVGPGQDGKMLLGTLFHVVVNGNGVQTVEKLKTEVLCH